MYTALHDSTDIGHHQVFKILVLTQNTTGRATQHHETHKYVDGTTHRILEPQNWSTAVFIHNFKHLMMTNVGRNM
jgi:hypothetical protein